MPGYSRECIGQTPFAWSLDDAMEGLGPRADRATAFWRWRVSEGAWAGFQKAVLGHLLGRLGPGRPVLGCQRRQAAVGRGVRTAADPRPAVHGAVHARHELPADAGRRAVLGGPQPPAARIELALATTLPSPEAARIFLWLAQYPWRAVTWFGPGTRDQVVPRARHLPAGRREHRGAAARRSGPAARAGGAGPVRVLLWRRPGALAVDHPISERERLFAKERGSASLVTQLAAQRRSWVVTA